MPKLPTADTPVAVYAGTAHTTTLIVLDALGAEYTPIKSFGELDEFGLLVIGAGAVDETVGESGELIYDWVSEGGKLLCLEQGSIGAVPWMKNMQITPAGYHGRSAILVDIIAEDHPVLNGFQGHEFDLWNGWRGQICDNYILPLDDAVLASCMFQRGGHKVGMALAEYRVGAGLCLLSQIEAVKRWGQDPIAAQYLARLLNYVLHGWDSRYARRAEASPMFVPPDSDKVFTVDLSGVANAPRKSRDQPSGKRSWIMGAGNDLEDLPAGRLWLLGIPFSILSADDLACVAAGPQDADVPQAVEGIPVKRNAGRLFVLGCVVGANEEMVRERKQVGIVRIHFGPHGPVATEDIPLVLGANIISFDKPGADLLSGAVAWSEYQIGHYRGPDKAVGVSLFVWENPHKEITVDSLSLIATNDCAPILLAITGEG